MNAYLWAIAVSAAWLVAAADPPPEPVTVSPALVDALENAENALAGSWAHDTIFNLRRAARALVDEVRGQA